VDEPTAPKTRNPWARFRERHRSKRAFHHVTDAGDVPALLVDAKTGRIAEANAAAAAMFASESSALVGQTVEDLMPATERPSHDHKRTGYGRRPRPEGHDVIAQRADGSRFRTRMGLAPLDGMVLAVLRPLRER
jgi:PAS domain S-box-containing protein